MIAPAVSTFSLPHSDKQEYVRGNLVNKCENETLPRVNSARERSVQRWIEKALSQRLFRTALLIGPRAFPSQGKTASGINRYDALNMNEIHFLVTNARSRAVFVATQKSKRRRKSETRRSSQQAPTIWS